MKPRAQVVLSTLVVACSIRRRAARLEQLLSTYENTGASPNGRPPRWGVSDNQTIVILFSEGDYRGTYLDRGYFVLALGGVRRWGNLPRS